MTLGLESSVLLFLKTQKIPIFVLHTKKKKWLMKKRVLIPVFYATLLLLIAACTKEPQRGQPQLLQVTIFSRHGARVPLKDYEEDLNNLIGKDREWPKWPVVGGHLSFRGATLEYIAGEIFRDQYKAAGFTFDATNVYVCASPKQRTVETARAFGTGFLSGVEPEVFYRGPKNFEPKYLDPEFLPLFDYTTDPAFNWDAFKAEALKEMNEKAAKVDLADDYRFLEEVLDFPNSNYAKSSGKKQFDQEIFFSVEKQTASGALAEPEIGEGCDLKKANRASDAFVLQYYEQDDSALAKYNLSKNLTHEDFVRLSAVKDIYGDVLFTAPIVAVNVSHNMLVMIKREMSVPGRKVNFICAHDSSIASLLAALNVIPYHLDPATTIESQTPIGVKIVIEKWLVNNEEMAKVYLAFYSSEQMRTGNPANLCGESASLQKYNLGFKGLSYAYDDYYRYSDLMAHIDNTLNLYYKTAKGQNPFE